MSIILTSTTYFRRQFGIAEFISNLGTLYQHHKSFNSFDKIVVVNEFSEEQVKNVKKNTELLCREFPRLQFIQKQKHEFGQANSLNMILAHLKDFDFQLHWEEGWICTRPFINDALAVMNESNISQLSVTSDYLDHDCRLAAIEHFGGVEIQALRQHPGFSSIDIHQYIDETRIKLLYSRLSRYPIELWPLYSLRPAINRIGFLESLPPFSTDNKLWPWRFELLYAMHWVQAGGTKAALLPSAANYSSNYASTHRVKANIPRHAK